MEASTADIKDNIFVHQQAVLERIAHSPSSLKCYGQLVLNDISGVPRFCLLIDSFCPLLQHLDSSPPCELETRIQLCKSIIASFACFELSGITLSGDITHNHFGVIATTKSVCISSGFDLFEIAAATLGEAVKQPTPQLGGGYSYRKNSSQIKVIVFGVLLASIDLFKRYATPFTAQSLAERELVKHESIKRSFQTFPGGLQRIFIDTSLASLSAFLEYLPSVSLQQQQQSQQPEAATTAEHSTTRHRAVEIEMQYVEKIQDIESSYYSSGGVDRSAEFESGSSNGSGGDYNSSPFDYPLNNNSRSSSEYISPSDKPMSQKLLVKEMRSEDNLNEPATPVISETKVMQILIIIAAIFLISGVMLGCFFRVTRKGSPGDDQVCENENCSSCEKFPDQCTTCASGYTLDTVTLFCTINCTETNCTSCITDYQVCEGCSAGYVLALSKCILQVDSCPIAQCASCKDLQCLTCKLGYELNVVTGACEKKCNVPACMICNLLDSFKCDVCAASYTLDANKKCAAR